MKNNEWEGKTLNMREKQKEAKEITNKKRYNERKKEWKRKTMNLRMREKKEWERKGKTMNKRERYEVRMIMGDTSEKERIKE